MGVTLVIPTVLVLVTIALPTAAEETPTVVVATRAVDVTPAASPDFLAWAAVKSPAGEAYQQALYVKRAGGERFRVNATDTWAIKPEIEGTLLAYTEGPYDEYAADIRFYDLATRRFVDPPAGVNTVGNLEHWPSISGDLLLFSREDAETSDEDVIVLDMTTGESQTLATSHGWRRWFWPGQINGDLVVWTRIAMDFKTGRWTSNDVYVHDLSTGVTTKLDNPGPRFQFGASVDASGTIYYGRGGDVCGQNAHLMSVVPGEEPVVLASFEPGQDFWTSYARDNADGSTTIFFDPGTCDGNILTDADIWSVDV